MCKLKFTVTRTGHREEIHKKWQSSLESQLSLENPRTEKNSLKLQNFSWMSVFLSLQSPKITYCQGEIQSWYSPGCYIFQTTQLSVCGSSSIFRRKDDSDPQTALTSIQQTSKVKQTQTYSKDLNIFSS